MYTRLSRTLACALLLPLAACDDASPKDADERAGAPVVGGKADISDRVKLLGGLDFGDARAGRFVEDLQFDAYTFRARAGARVDLEVSRKGTSTRVDTTLFVYGPKGADGYGTAAKFFDDDSGWGRHARLRGLQFEQPGEYLVVVGTYDARGRGQYRVTLDCPDGGCALPVWDPPEGCAFGDTWNGLNRTPGLRVVRETVVRDAAALDAVGQAQLIAAQHAAGADFVSTVEEAFEYSDDGAFYVVELYDVTNARAFTGVEFFAGDTSVGAIFAADSAEVVAVNGDGDLYDCTVPPGPAGRDCDADEACFGELSCQGIDREIGLGRCVDAASRAEEGRDCNPAAPCPADMFCSGATRNREQSGLCLPAWMMNTFDADEEIVLAPGEETLEIPIAVYGLATVDTDVQVGLKLMTRGPTELLVTLTNPDGNEVKVFEGALPHDTHWFEEVPTGFSGDESVNGTWTLRITDRAQVGFTLYRWHVTLGSRWD